MALALSVFRLMIAKIITAALTQLGDILDIYVY